MSRKTILNWEIQEKEKPQFVSWNLWQRLESLPWDMD